VLVSVFELTVALHYVFDTPSTKLSLMSGIRAILIKFLQVAVIPFTQFAKKVVFRVLSSHLSLNTMLSVLGTPAQVSQQH
jgi:hypothetical protein